MNNHYNKNLLIYAKELRTQSVSRAEKYIWKALLSSNKQGVKFKRQRPISKFIVDFFAQEIGLIIEIDGSSHDNKGEYDRYREDLLISLGYHLIRFSEGVYRPKNPLPRSLLTSLHVAKVKEGRNKIIN